MKSGESLKDLGHYQKIGKPKGVYSICSYDRYVIEAALLQAVEDDSVVLIESTCNQVNQFGGYTGMNPVDFKEYIFNIAKSMNFPFERIILGGDHLGPFPFQNEKISEAMDKAREMVRQYVLAGCRKIHIDTSMPLVDDQGDRNAPLEPRTIAERCADLCSISEETFQALRTTSKDAGAPVYVIGTDVPAPGGSDRVEGGLRITTVSDFEETVNLTKESFRRQNLHSAWERVIAVVVQPGFEYGDRTIIEYDGEKAKTLIHAIKKHPNLVFEGHSTDYQSSVSLKRMVEDSIAILKVGPYLTFTAREAIFMLNYIEEELLKNKSTITLSNFIGTLDDVMTQNPEHWIRYYRGNKEDVQFSKKYSFLDRSRYYRVNRRVLESLSRLIQNLHTTDIPLALISQFLPQQYIKLMAGLLPNDPEALIRDRVRDILKIYSCAAGDREKV